MTLSFSWTRTPLSHMVSGFSIYFEQRRTNTIEGTYLEFPACTLVDVAKILRCWLVTFWVILFAEWPPNGLSAKIEHASLKQS